MSGGSYDYAYIRIQDFAESLRLNGTRLSPEALTARQEFKAHLLLVAEAMRAIEWVDSGDYGAGEEIKAIRAALDSVGDLKAASGALVKAIDTCVNGRREDACVACGTDNGECPASCPLELTRSALGVA
jgi:hypothetical protein